MDEVLNAQARFSRTVLQAFALELGACGSRVISYLAVDSSAGLRSMSKLSRVTLRLLGAFAIEANVGGRPIQKGSSAARLSGDEAGLPREAGRTRHTVLG